MIRIINKDAFSHSWKSMLSCLHKMARYITSSVHHASACSPRTSTMLSVCYFQRDCCGVALHEAMQKIHCLQIGGQQLDLARDKPYKARTDSSQTCTETLPGASVSTTLTFPKLTCHIKHFPLDLITRKGYRTRR